MNIARGQLNFINGFWPVSVLSCSPKAITGRADAKKM